MVDSDNNQNTFRIFDTEVDRTPNTLKTTRGRKKGFRVQLTLKVLNF